MTLIEELENLIKGMESEYYNHWDYREKDEEQRCEMDGFERGREHYREELEELLKKYKEKK